MPTERNLLSQLVSCLDGIVGFLVLFSTFETRTVSNALYGVGNWKPLGKDRRPIQNVPTDTYPSRQQIL